ncbi:hypothetical protein EJ02DRAFT_428729 [Clathrospora elynae]|uniref:Uncharacterized protein n=1 Tax=Clathrospora elynae TaxID=706981 RepID=A0A6A5S5T3_9PLEO|nr:hypothetical protein EJ02DRAFT_428729 [Clathrospora elynae]
MAGTRWPRVSDTNTDTSALQHQRSMSHTASVFDFDENSDAGAQPAAEIPESADEGSPGGGLPLSRSTKGFCRNCKSNVGEFYNSWHRITGSYYVPALLGSYSTTLRSTGKLKAASKGTDLEGCTIQPLSCPNTGCTDSPIGFTVVITPAGKGNFCGRDFFKLNRIELRCEIAPNQIIVVVPREDAAPDLLAVADSPSPSPEPARTPKAPSMEAMVIDTLPQPSRHPSQHHSPHEQHYEHNERQQFLQPVEVNRQSLPPAPSSMRSPPDITLQGIPKKTPSSPLSSPSLAVQPIPEHQHGPYVPLQGTIISSTNGMQDRPSFTPQSLSPKNPQHVNGQHYPRPPQEVGLDAIERLQTQVSQNSGALAAHTRDIRRGEESFQQLEVRLRRDFQAQLTRQAADIRRVEDSAARLQHDMQGMHQMMEGLSRELHATRVDRQSRGSTTQSGQSLSVQDSALELMAQQMATMAQKTTDMDTLRITIEIMKGKIHRLEGGAAPVPSQSTPHNYQTPQESVVQSAQPTYTAAPSYNATPAVLQQANQVPQPVPHAQSFHSFATPSSTTAPESTQRTEPNPGQSSGWATINAGVKRVHESGVESPLAANMHVPGSPKRQKLVISDPHDNWTPSQSFTSGQYDQMETGGSEVRLQTPAHTLPSQHSMLESVQAPQSQQSVYIPYATQDGPSDDSWRPESQRIIEHRPRGRGRGGGPGSRGGRGRKSMPAQLQPLGAPEWENSDWQGASDGQTSPDGFYNHTARSGRGGIARRGSGGGGGGTHGGYAPSDRAASLGSQGVTAAGMSSFGSPGDPYGHSKRTRTKPIRNADGVLIRKDGRPDMRSQSSAANLRKVHARKEGEASHSPTGFTPTNLQYATSADALDTPSPSGYAADPAATDKHNAIMGKVFPSGVDASRRQHDYMRQAFEENGDQTVHPRTQNHASATMKTPLQIKKEQFEQNHLAELQSPREEDVDMGMDMERAEDSGDIEVRMPDEQSQ